MKTYIFACVHNAGRSQMAARFFNHLAGGSKSRAISAGTNPAPAINPVVAEAMQEIGLPFAPDARPQKLTVELCRGAEKLFTLGCKENCPYVPGLKVEDWPFPDPQGKSLQEIRLIRDAIRERITQFLLSADR
ncbi:MAG: phosphotyrosine protein phosphatase [Bdellovibrionales bacterium]|nr:phosphotyrosine protein phosphatase [Bdellovibrionales bacterium]